VRGGEGRGRGGAREGHARALLRPWLFLPVRCSVAALLGASERASVCATAVNDRVIAGSPICARSLSNEGPERRDVKEYRIEMSFSINVRHKRRSPEGESPSWIRALRHHPRFLPVSSVVVVVVVVVLFRAHRSEICSRINRDSRSNSREWR